MYSKEDIRKRPACLGSHHGSIKEICRGGTTTSKIKWDDWRDQRGNFDEIKGHLRHVFVPVVVVGWNQDGVVRLRYVHRRHVPLWPHDWYPPPAASPEAFRSPLPVFPSFLLQYRLILNLFQLILSWTKPSPKYYDTGFVTRNLRRAWPRIERCPTMTSRTPYMLRGI